MVYLDHAATTPMRAVTKSAWLEASTYLNPAGQYGAGRQARSVLDDARELVASLLGAEPIEVVFTASGTEADNLAIQGYYEARGATHPRVISSDIEHAAVYDTVRHLEASRGAHLELLSADRSGFIHDAHDALDQPAAVASFMWANNETGAIQPISSLIAGAAATGTPVHIDAVQVAGKIPIDFAALGASSLAVSGHKFGGPRGVGVLLVKRNPAPRPLFHGGGQERGLRSGTVDVAGAWALARALEEAVADIDAENRRLERLKEKVLRTVSDTVDDVLINTPELSLSSHINFSFPGCEGDSLIMLLDAMNIAASTGSACANGVNRASRVLLAQGLDDATARGTLRITLGYTTTEDDVDTLLAALPKVVERARAAGMAST
ncbi:cysteine desulfurase [Corynebacterium sp. ES2730-CONJ]|uniref:cysteine desulfurase family protein n=1 Tax=Corynebacterium sp. ES2730-CONJ TaxID=2973941 RepID=UPI00216B5955|nr:cysteine desulfurase family protein [Corynebacterium sp. ES2730-CONJ]MCS4531937.1 cysteine desulfurase [Corynebacterium sp. ES2730-CONJ]